MVEEEQDADGVEKCQSKVMGTECLLNSPISLFVANSHKNMENLSNHGPLTC